MSSRTGRRHSRKSDDPPFRAPSQRKESPKTKQHAQQMQQHHQQMQQQMQQHHQMFAELPKPIEPEIVAKKAEELGKMNEPIVPLMIVEEVIETTKNEEATNGNGVQVLDTCVIVEDGDLLGDPELEPLVVDSEDPELQFDDNSEKDSHSPVLSNRCSTRRSQTRNIPTPKTPKSVCESNGDDKEHTPSAGATPEQNGGQTPRAEAKNDAERLEIDLTAFESNIETPPPTEELLTLDEGDATAMTASTNEKELNVSVESCESALSTQVNIGSDVTREIDLTMPEESSFLNTAKDLSVVETLRRMSSRRAIRSNNTDYRKTLLKQQAEKHEAVLQQRASIERVPGTKRKTRSKTPENAKRLKTTDASSPGFLSYISSPLTMLRNRFGGNAEAVSASTPKLTGYKEQDPMQDPELSKIEDAKVPAEKKRCVIM